MAAEAGINRKAVATRVAQRLAGPAEAILGYQELIAEDLAKSGPLAAAADAARVLAAAGSLAGSEAETRPWRKHSSSRASRPG
jgi:hypothetical protein